MFNPKNKARRHLILYFFDLFSILMSIVFSFAIIEILNSYTFTSRLMNGDIISILSILLILPVSHLSVGLYDTKIRQSIRGVFRRTILSAALTFGFMISLTMGVFSIKSPALFYVITLGMSAFMHTAWRLWVIYHGGIDSVKRKVIFIGAGDRAGFVSARMRRHVDRKHFVFGGFIALKKGAFEPRKINNLIKERETVIGLDAESGDLNELVKKTVCDIYVLANDVGEELPLIGLLDAKMKGVEIVELEDFIEAELGQIAVENMKEEWLLNSKGFNFSRNGYGLFNYMSNALMGVLVLLLTWPLMIGAMLAIYFDDGKKDKDAGLFYKQERVGLNGNKFNIIKFRSMGKDAEKDGAKWATKNDIRITRVGNYLRKYRIDELPQLLNIFKGEMCFVGPRPERPQFVEELSKEIPLFEYRHFVKPGLTGWAQVKYPYGASKEDSLEKLKFDLYYIKHKSFLMDILVLIRTVETVTFGNGR